MTIKFDRANSLKKIGADSKNTGDPVSQISILTGPIIRDSNGLALSSRNMYLNKEDKKI